MKKLCNTCWGFVKKLLVIFLFASIISCEENVQPEEGQQIATAPIGSDVGIVPLADDQQLWIGTCDDATRCNASNNSFCCRGYEVLFSMRGRSCPDIGGCLDYCILDKLILYYRLPLSSKLTSVIRAKNNAIFARSYLISYDKQTETAAIGYKMINPQMAKEPLFIQVTLNDVNGQRNISSTEIRSGFFIH
jgi:hypothetical protein